VNADLSVAPEIAQLAAPLAPVQDNPGQYNLAPDTAAPRTDGRVAGDLADLAAAPQRWWDLVRFDPDGPVRIPVPGAPGTWLLVLPPGASTVCDCQQATALAGEAVETAAGQARAPGASPENGARPGRPLRPGRVRVHGTPATHRLHAAGPGYSVTLHATVGRTRSLSIQKSRYKTGRGSPLAPRRYSSRGSSAKSSPRVTRRPSAVGQYWERLDDPPSAAEGACAMDGPRRFAERVRERTSLP
jgi:hypothetical protein